MTTPIKTQCPNCYTYFQLPTNLLALIDQSSMDVRCGNCQHVFLANDYLIVSANNAQAADLVSLEQANSSAQNPDIASNSLAQRTSIESTRPTNSHSSEHLNSTSNQSSYHADKQNGDMYLNTRDDKDSWLEELIVERNENVNGQQCQNSSTTTLANSMDSYQERLNKGHNQNATSRSESLELQAQSKMPWDTLLWTIGCLVLVLLLFAQYIIFNLNVLIKNPEHAERLQFICTIAVCSLPFAEIEAFGVSELRFTSSRVNSEASFSDIQAVLNNKSAQMQILPDLRVGIYSDDKLLGDFIAEPKNYLLNDQTQFAAEYSKPFMFTVPIAYNQITQVTIDPIY